MKIELFLKKTNILIYLVFIWNNLILGEICFFFFAILKIFNHFKNGVFSNFRDKNRINLF